MVFANIWKIFQITKFYKKKKRFTHKKTIFDKGYVDGYTEYLNSHLDEYMRRKLGCLL